MSRFFEEGKSVFIKPATTFKSLITDMKLLFYQSHEDTGYVGDAVFLTKKEVEDYLNEQEKWKGVRVRKGNTKKKNWIALQLEDVTQYDTIVKPERFVPVGGMYLRE